MATLAWTDFSCFLLSVGVPLTLIIRPSENRICSLDMHPSLCHDEREQTLQHVPVDALLFGPRGGGGLGKDKSLQDVEEERAQRLLERLVLLHLVAVVPGLLFSVVVRFHGSNVQHLKLRPLWSFLTSMPWISRQH